MTASDRRWSDADRGLVALALAGRVRYSQHGQRCPVWTRAKGVEIGEQRAPSEAELARCDCWIMGQARRDAAAVLDALTAAGRLRENATADIEAAFRERRDDTGQRPLHPEAVAAYQHAIVIARRVPDA